MTTAVLTTKGQIVIPSAIRKHLGLKKGTKLCIMEEGTRIVIQPLTRDYFEQVAGILKSKENLTDVLHKERAKEKEREDRK